MAEETANELTDRWSAWIGRERLTKDVLDLGRARAMQALLNHEGPPLGMGHPLPPLWHWLYFWEVAPTSELGSDGHPRRGEFLPPIPLPRRMWAGSRVRFGQDLALGSAVLRRSVISGVAVKEGRSGPLAFVTVRHTISAGSATLLEDEQDLVYREARKPGEAPPEVKRAPEAPIWAEQVEPDPVLLFRYSALTFNGHRIHYDRPYAIEAEGYPGLVVHGPLLATLMMEGARRAAPGKQVERFEFRALAPVFDLGPFTLAGRSGPTLAEAEVWAARADGGMAVSARVKFREDH